MTLGSAVDTWATVAVAIGTLGAVAYALFRDLVVTPRRRPTLELRFDRTGNDQVILQTADDVKSACVRLRVSNRAGKDTADDVVVIVTELRRLGAPEETANDARPIGLPLCWSGTSPPLTVASVHPGSERHLDLMQVDWPADRGEVGIGAPVRLTLSPRPAGDHGNLAPGRYEVLVDIRARNADAARYAIAVTWDGEWSGKSAMWEHLVVDPPRPTR